MDQKDLITKFLNLEDEDEEIVEAWNLFIEAQKALRDVEARIISRREGDNVRRTFLRYMGKHGLKTLNEEQGLKAHEFAIVKRDEGDENKVKPLNELDLWLLTDFGEVCALWVADDFRGEKGFPDMIIAFLEDPRVDDRLRERLIEKDKARGEKLLKTILEDRPAEVPVHSLLVKHYEGEGRLADAEAEYKRILTVTDDEFVWANYGEFLEKRGRYEEAFDAFKASFEVCERLGKGETGLGEIVRKCISRVERMKNLEGDEAKKAREYHEALWLLDEVREFAERRFAEEIGVAQGEYRKEKGIEEIDFGDIIDFSNWFLFTRKLGDGRTPGIVYAEEKGLSEELKERIRGLGMPVKGTFEVVSVEPASFTFMVKNTVTDEEYEVRGDDPAITEGFTFAGTIYPWGDFYLTGGTLRTEKEEVSGDEKAE
jgi:tetratricopeptide (TPR) repeat protein